MKPWAVQDKRSIYRLICLLIPLVVAFSSLLLSSGVVKAAVTLVYFRAIPADRRVDLQWKTATELNTLGFFVQRSNQRDSGYARVNGQIILAQGDGLTGADYQYPDQDSALLNGSQYWYILEEIDDDNQSSILTTPISAVVGVTLTPVTPATATTSITVSVSASATATQTVQPVGNTTGVPTATAPAVRTAASQPTTVQPTPSPGVTVPAAYPPPGQAAPALAPTEVAVGAVSQGPTATLVPFPTVTIIFSGEQAAPLPPDLSSLPGYNNEINWEQVIDLWPLGLILLAWIVLGAWFFISHRHA